jgi:hypothetical protein
VNRQARADGRGHRLFNQSNITCASANNGFPDGSSFNLRGLTGHTNEDSGTRANEAILMHFLDEVLEHPFGYLKIRYNTIFQGSNRRYIPGGPSKHSLGINADGSDVFLVVIIANRDHRRLVKYDTLTSNINKRIGCAKIYRQIIRKKTAKALKH